MADTGTVALFVYAAANVVEAVFCVMLYKVSRDLAIIAKRDSVANKPLFRVFYNGIKNRPRDPARDMCAFMFTVENEGGRDSAIGNCDVVGVRDDGTRQSVYMPIVALEDFTGTDFSRLPGPINAAEPHTVPSSAARRFIGILPANSGYQSWSKVRLVIHPVGGTEGSCVIEWKDEYAAARVPLVPSHLDARPDRRGDGRPATHVETRPDTRPGP